MQSDVGELDDGLRGAGESLFGIGRTRFQKNDPLAAAEVVVEVEGDALADIRVASEWR